MSKLVEHAKRELTLAKLYREDSVDSHITDEYDNAIAAAVIELVQVFADQRHSGMSAAMTRGLLIRLLSYDTLSPLTNNPDEWNFIPEEMSGEPDGLWQNIRNSSAFSKDAGRTYWTLDGVEANGGRDMAPLYVTEEHVVNA